MGRANPLPIIVCLQVSLLKAIEGSEGDFSVTLGNLIRAWKFNPRYPNSFEMVCNMIVAKVFETNSKKVDKVFRSVFPDPLTRALRQHYPEMQAEHLKQAKQAVEALKALPSATQITLELGKRTVRVALH